MTSRDWRLPENRREAFQRFYTFQLETKGHPGCVYALLPAIADYYDLDDDQRAWLAWLNGNTQNVVTSLLLLDEAPHPRYWARAVEFWNENFKLLEWDTDRRHQKSKFGEATEDWFMSYGHHPAAHWYAANEVGGWEAVWQFALSQPHFGRLSAWSGLEYARILLGNDVIPDMGTWLLNDKSGSRSHRNGIGVVAGYEGAEYWGPDDPFMLGVVGELEAFADELLREAVDRNREHRHDGFADLVHPDVSRLTMESALCTYKGWHKPNRRYPNVYADMMYNRIKKAEARFPHRDFGLLWQARIDHLPRRLRLEDMPEDPGLSAIKQNHYLETGEVVMLDKEYPDMQNSFNARLDIGAFPPRKDPKYV